MSDGKLTERQRKAIPCIVSSGTYTEGCKRAKINRATVHKWLKQPEFKAEIERQRNEIASEAFGLLSQSITKAIGTLADLLDNGDDRLRRLAARDIVEYYLKYKEIKTLAERLDAVERKLRISG